ncbi:MAG: gluconate 2-dehydrogenase subunit 3 family protein [Verrucomicrobia bacterium]|nr:gluconate 2-dehydrogenase subunit 3 family protein [Verrucomicrobiota bacterium]
MPKDTSKSSSDLDALTYFTDFQARTIEAIADRIIPADGTHGGATEAGVVYYIDRAISGFSIGLQRVYRLGLRELEHFCERQFRAQFVDLNPEQQDQVIRWFIGDEVRGTNKLDRTQSPFREMAASEGTAEGIDFGLLHSMFAVIREHTVEGYFCDPVYGGNRGAIGWQLVGFPGVQWGYTAEQMKPGFDARQIPIKTLADLRRELNNLPDNAQYWIKPR